MVVVVVVALVLVVVVGAAANVILRAYNIEQVRRRFEGKRGDKHVQSHFYKATKLI